MGNYLKKLIDISSDPLVKIDAKFVSVQSGLLDELQSLLNIKNGFYAFESALLVRPSNGSELPYSNDIWNKHDVWKYTYDFDLSNMYFFAEDIFGGQFAIYENSIMSFDPETGETEEISDTLEGWAEEILKDYDFFTGYSIARRWQKENGVLKYGERLLPKRLFVLGGEFEIDNLYVKNDVKAMRVRGGFANKLKDLPDGEKIEFEFTD